MGRQFVEQQWFRNLKAATGRRTPNKSRHTPWFSIDNDSNFEYTVRDSFGYPKSLSVKTGI